MKRTLALALVVAACAGVENPRTPRTAGALTSNLRRADYAGSGACAKCHPAIAERWEKSPMHNMTRTVDRATIHAPFDGTVFRFKDDTVTLETRGGARWVKVSSRERGEVAYEVTRVIGGRVREDFAGVPDHGAKDERVLPVSWLIAPKRLRYKGYSVMVEERSGIREGAVWGETCIFCHNTSPQLLSLLGALAGPRAPAYQGVVVDRLLPPDRRWTFEVTDEPALRAAVDAELAAFGAHGDGRLGHAIAATRAGFRASNLLETGIGCEACHGGARAHAENPGVRPSFVPTSPFLRVVGDTSRPAQINHACARCHQVLFSRYPWTWEGGKRQSAQPGGSNINSGEARDMLLGACKGVSCVDCHDVHGTRPRADENAVCTKCHTMAPDHARHGKSPPSCASCHMAEKNMSLTSTLTRYHRVGSPTDPMRVMLDRPLECAICHQDKSVEQVLGDMERLFGKRYERETLRALYGDLGANVMTATLLRGKPHEQAVALAVLGRARRKDAAADIARALTHPYPLVREYARDALDRVLGARCDVDLADRREDIAEKGRKCLELQGIAVPRGDLGAPPREGETDEGED